MEPKELPLKQRRYPYKRGFFAAASKGNLFHYKWGMWRRVASVKAPWGADILVTVYTKNGDRYEFVPFSHSEFYVLTTKQQRELGASLAAESDPAGQMSFC